MESSETKQGYIKMPVIAVFFGFFIMGFVDFVGTATNYIKSDFSLSSTMANTLPMMVFLWFALFSIPSGILLGKIGRKNTVLLSLGITAVSIVMPYFFYSFEIIAITFVLLGISNTILQVSLNPLVAAMFSKEKTASMLTMGQFIKAISSFSGPIIAAFMANKFGDWKLAFVIFSITSLLSFVMLFFSKTKESGFENSPTSFKSALGWLKDKKIMYCFFCIILIVGFDVGMNISIPELLMSRTDLPLTDAGLGISVYFAARTAGSLIGVILLLKFKPIKFLRISLVIAMAAMLILLFVDYLWMLVALIFIAGFLCANVFSIIYSYALQRSPAHSNEISALMIMGVSGGAIITPIQGIANDYMGFTFALSILLVCLFIITLFTQKMKENEK